MNEHPDQLLAAYVDGDASAEDIRAVRSHLRSCERCRREVEMAERARDALASLPEVPAPSGTAFRVLRETPRSPASGTVWRIATAVGVAASLIVGAVVLFQRADFGGMQDAGDDAQRRRAGAASAGDKGGTEDTAEGAAAPQAVSAARGALPRLRVANTRYESDDMPQVLDRLQEEANELIASALRADETRFESAVNAGERTVAALECASSAIRTATAIEDPGVPFVLEKASFYDEFAEEYVPGYVAAYLDAPSPDEPPNSLFMTVIDRETCDRLLYYAEPVQL